ATAAEYEKGRHGRPVEQHGTGAAFAELAAVVRAREPGILAEHLEQGLVRREGDLDGLAVQLERDLRFGVGHESRNVILITGRCGASFPLPFQPRVTYGGGLADRRKGGRKNGAGARGLAVRPSARPSVSAGLPRPSSPDPQDRPLDRRAQRYSRRDPRAWRP